MSANPPDERRPSARQQTQRATAAVVSTYGAFRVVLILLAVWSFFEGFALFTGGVPGLSFGGGRSAQAAVGGHMIIMSALYGLLAWQRERYRLLVWTPFAGQLVLIIPTLFALFGGNAHGLLLLIISIVFLVLLVYFWWERQTTYETPDDAFDDGADEDDEPPAAQHPLSRPGADDARQRGRFRRRQ